MHHNRVSTSVIGLALLLSLGCGSHPIPRVAVAGTTIAIPIPHWFGAGFGRAMNQVVPYGPFDPAGAVVPYTAGSVLEDEQRGEVLFALHTVNDAASGFLTYLPVKRIIRVHLDEGSTAANPAPDETLPTMWGTNYKHGQVVAFVNIPAGLGQDYLGEGSGPNDYWIFPQLWRREQPDLRFVRIQPMTNDPSEPWLGWTGDTPADGIPIRIRPAEDPGTTRFNPETGWDDYFGDYAHASVEDDLNLLVPRPKAPLWVANYATQESPAAWEAEIKYPRNKIEILGVEAGRYSRSGTLVRWQPDDPLNPCNVEGEGSFRVFMVDPDQETPLVKIVYRVRPLDEDGCQGHVVDGDFQIDFATFKAYDRDGLHFPTNVFFGVSD